MKILHRLGLISLILVFWQIDLSAARIKDLSFLKGGRPNQLVGFSIVVGLNGTGDSEGSLANRTPLVNALSRMGITLDPADILGRSIAAVMVTATLPAFAKQGQKVDVLVSAIGDAITLNGGILLMTPLRASNQTTYAVAQGPVSDVPRGIELPDSIAITGNQPLSLDAYQTYLPTVGRVIAGGYVERNIDFELNLRTYLDFTVIEPDFTTSHRIARAINQELGVSVAKAQDAASVIVEVPKTYLDRVVELIARIENLSVHHDQVAKVVIDQRSGMVVMGDNVTIAPVAISYNNLNLVIREQEILSATDQVPTSDLAEPGLSAADLAQSRNVLLYRGGASLKELVDGLNRIGTTNRELIEILKNIRSAGALNAELIIK